MNGKAAMIEYIHKLLEDADEELVRKLFSVVTIIAEHHSPRQM